MLFVELPIKFDSNLRRRTSPGSLFPSAHPIFISSAGTLSCSLRFAFRRSVERRIASIEGERERHQRIELPIRQ